VNSSISETSPSIFAHELASVTYFSSLTCRKLHNRASTPDDDVTRSIATSQARIDYGIAELVIGCSPRDSSEPQLPFHCLDLLIGRRPSNIPGLMTRIGTFRTPG
jgi:hypothetical protein